MGESPQSCVLFHSAALLTQKETVCVCYCSTVADVLTLPQLVF